MKKVKFSLCEQCLGSHGTIIHEKGGVQVYSKADGFGTLRVLREYSLISGQEYETLYRAVRKSRLPETLPYGGSIVTFIPVDEDSNTPTNIIGESMHTN